MHLCILVVSSVSCSHLGVFYERLRNTGSAGLCVECVYGCTCMMESWGASWLGFVLIYTHPGTRDKSAAVSGLVGWWNKKKGSCMRCCQTRLTFTQKHFFSFQKISESEIFFAVKVKAAWLIIKTALSASPWFTGGSRSPSADSCFSASGQEHPW